MCHDIDLVKFKLTGRKRALFISVLYLSFIIRKCRETLLVLTPHKDYLMIIGFVMIFTQGHLGKLKKTMKEKVPNSCLVNSFFLEKFKKFLFHKKIDYMYMHYLNLDQIYLCKFKVRMSHNLSRPCLVMKMKLKIGKKCL